MIAISFLDRLAAWKLHWSYEIFPGHLYWNRIAVS